jgi:hypothetical protein
MDDRAQLSTFAFGRGNAGCVEVRAGRLTLTEKACSKMTGHV